MVTFLLNPPFPFPKPILKSLNFFGNNGIIIKKNGSNKWKLAVALDLSDKKESLKLLNRLSRFDNLWIKVGLRSYIRDGNLFLDEIKAIQ